MMIQQFEILPLKTICRMWRLKSLVFPTTPFLEFEINDRDAASSTVIGRLVVRGTGCPVWSDKSLSCHETFIALFVDSRTMYSHRGSWYLPFQDIKKSVLRTYHSPVLVRQNNSPLPIASPLAPPFPKRPIHLVIKKLKFSSPLSANHRISTLPLI
jgi:hypothetical protein